MLWTDLTPRERDAAIAERVMGWSAADVERERTHDGSTYFSPSADSDGGLPHYSTDISAAWQLIEQHPHYVSLARSNDTGSRSAPWGPVSWRCRFYAPEKFEVQAETAPEAICLAALKAIDVVAT